MYTEVALNSTEFWGMLLCVLCVLCVGVAVGVAMETSIHESPVSHTRRVCGVHPQTRRFLTQSEAPGVHTRESGMQDYQFGSQTSRLCSHGNQTTRSPLCPWCHLLNVPPLSGCRAQLRPSVTPCTPSS